MDSALILSVHKIATLLFLVTYLIKTILLFSNRTMLDKYAAKTKVPEMIISFAFLATGIWLYVIIGGIKTLGIIKLVCVFISIPLAVIGFKRHKKVLALFSLLLIIGAYGLAEMSKSKPFIPSKASISLSNTDPVFAEGAAVYHANCAFCHGDDGKKMYRNASDLSKSIASEVGIKQMILEGVRGKMPAYKSVLSDQQISAVARYVAGIRPPANVPDTVVTE